MKLWGGRFTKETNQLVHNFNESLSFDQKFYRQDIRGSIAHVKMLAKQGILTEQDRDDIIRGLESILEDLDNGKLAISSDSGYEDIHSFVEGTLTERIGEAGKRLHTGRSRNDQVALDMKLYTRDEIDAIEALVKELLEEYDVSYIFVGSKEREKYGDALNEEVLNSLGEVVFQDEEYSTYILKVNK